MIAAVAIFAIVFAGAMLQLRAIRKQEEHEAAVARLREAEMQERSRANRERWKLNRDTQWKG